jgi:CheY-like chemotaxis protein
VEDDGIGISSDDQKKLFTPFFQVQESSTQKGSGLGLAITNKLVGLLGGEISVESDKGKGSVFSFTITTQSYKEYERLVEDTTHRIKGKYILVADENVDDRLGVGEILFEAGLRPIICSSDKEVLSLVSAQRYTFSAIVLSATFPASSVLENLRHVRENIPVVITTENTQEKWLSENVTITKPVNKIQLLDILLKLINKDNIEDCQLNEVKPDKIPKRDVSILIAEDNTYNADILVKMLNTIGYNKIDIATDGSEAVKKIDEQYEINRPYNVLLLDLKMPVMDGIEVAQHIHANKYENLKTVVITSSVAESDKARCKELGVKYFLLKPYSMTQLKLFMNKMLE